MSCNEKKEENAYNGNVDEEEESMDWENINVENLREDSKSVRSKTTVENMQENALSNTSDRHQNIVQIL